MRFLFWLAAVVVVAFLLRVLVLAVRKDREDEEDQARRLRLMNEYAVPDFAVEMYRVVPTAEVRAPRREWPEITSDYRTGVRRGGTT